MSQFRDKQVGIISALLAIVSIAVFLIVLSPSPAELGGGDGGSLRPYSSDSTSQGAVLGKSELYRRLLADVPVPTQEDGPARGLSTADDAAATAEVHGDSLALCECPAAYRSEFNVFRRLARSREIEIGRNLRMTSKEWRAMKERVAQLQDDFAQIDEERTPILNDLVDSRMAAQEYECFAHPDSAVDPEARRELQRKLAQASKPKRAGEIVISGAVGSSPVIMRIQPEEVPRLYQIQHMIDRLKIAAGDELVAMFYHRL